MELLKTVFVFLSKVLPSVLLTWISLILITRRISHKIKLSYSITGSRHTKTRLSNIVLYNKKDRVEVIQKIELVVNKKYIFTVISLEKPQVIKPFECIQFNTEPITEYMLGSEYVDLHNMMRTNDYYFNIYTDGKLIRYKKPKIRKVNKRQLKRLEKLQVISTIREKYNDVVINDTVIFAIIYIENGKHKTGFIDEAGIIDGDWDFGFNVITISDLKDSKLVYDKLVSIGLLNYVDKFEIDDLRKTFWKKMKKSNN